MDLSHELVVAEALARRAGADILRLFGSGIAVEYKPGGDGPVTRADKDANALLVGGLHAAFPDDAILSEEAPDDGSRRTHERVWMVDPLDGTSDFIRGRAGFSVMIGLCVAGRPALGVVFQPTTGVAYRARAGQGAESVQPDGSAAPLRVSDIQDVGAVRLVASASHRTERIDRVRSALGITDEMNIGSVGLKLGLIARGQRDLYVNPNSMSSLWDTCGPEAILVEAGGKLSDIYGRPLDYTGESVRNGKGLVASNGKVHDAVIAKLAPLFPDGV